MKKQVLLVFLMVFVLLLCACNNQEQQSESPEQNQPVTQIPEANNPGSDSPISPEDENATQKPITRGYAFIYNKDLTGWIDGDTLFAPNLSGCIADALYYVDRVTEEVYLICEGPVVEFTENFGQIYKDSPIFFVTAAEPNRIYVTSPAEHTKHTLVYESDSGKITSVLTGAVPFTRKALQFIVDNRQFIWLELDTGEATVVMEQYYLEYAYFEDDNPDAKSWKDLNAVCFLGKLNEDDTLRHYRYWVDQDMIEKVTYE